MNSTPSYSKWYVTIYCARYYSAGTARFLSEDPIGFRGLDENLYRYVVNAPLIFVDPSGKVTLKDVKKKIKDAVGSVVDACKRKADKLKKDVEKIKKGTDDAMDYFKKKFDEANRFNDEEE